MARRAWVGLGQSLRVLLAVAALSAAGVGPALADTGVATPQMSARVAPGPHHHPPTCHATAATATALPARGGSAQPAVVAAAAPTARLVAGGQVTSFRCALGTLRVGSVAARAPPVRSGHTSS